MLEARFFGQFDLCLDGQPVEIRSRPAQSLLAFLLIHGGVAYRREKLAGLFWLDFPEADARRNLRQALWHIRHALGEKDQARLVSDDIWVKYDETSAYYLDVKTLEQKTGPEQDPEALFANVSVYQGELLPGFYEEWVILERERLQGVFEQKMRLLLERLVAAQRWQEALEWGERWIAHGLTPESAYQALMTAHCGLGDQAGVRAVYRRCQEALRRELGVAPSESTRLLFEKYIQVTLSPTLPGVSLFTSPPSPSIVDMSWTSPAGDPAPGEAPFKGLQAFDEADTDLFFGREALVANLVARLFANHSDGRNGDQPGESLEENLIILVGASGSGKSSLVRAGLVPALRYGRHSPDSQASEQAVHLLTPTARPLEALAACLTQGIESVSAALSLLDDLAQDSRSLHIYAARLARQAGISPLFIVVDQFEELFTLCRDAQERASFIDNLLIAAAAGSAKVIVALRADYYTHCMAYEGLRRALACCQALVGPLGPEELRRAIEEPARRNGWLFEPGVVDLIIREIGAEPGALPLLSQALLETWKRRSGRMLTLAGYAETGGVHQAIARSAERAFAALEPEQQKVARGIFLRLTEPGQDPGNGIFPTHDTRRRVSVSEFFLEPGSGDQVREVLKRLAEARLVTMERDTVEVAHEALIREWPDLKQWLAEDREGLRLHRHITEAAQGWEALDREPGELYRGARLAQAAEWAAGHSAELNPLEKEFLETSRSLADKEAVEREFLRERELAAAQKIAETEARRAGEQAKANGILRLLAAFLTIFLLAAAILAGLAFTQRNRADHQARISTSRELAAFAVNNIQVDPERSTLLALQALTTADTYEAQDALHQALQAIRLLRVIPLLHQFGLWIAFSPDGQRLAIGSASPQGELQTEIWDIISGKRLFVLPGLLAVNKWPDGNMLPAVMNGPQDSTTQITFYNPQNGTVHSSILLDYPFSEIQTGNISPDMSLTAAALLDGTTIISDLATGQRLRTLGKPDGQVNFNVVFTPDNKGLVATVDGITRIWNIASGNPEVILPSSDPGSSTVEFSQDGDQVALGIGPSVVLADSQTGEKKLTLTGHSGIVYNIRFEPKGYNLAASGSDGKILVWDAQTGQAIYTLSGHGAAVNGIAYNPTGSKLASASFDGTARLWDITPIGSREGPALYDIRGLMYTSIAFSPDGQRVVVSGGSQAGDVWETATGKRLFTLRGLGKYQGSIAFSPDGKTIAGTSGEETIKIWDSGGSLQATLSGHKDWIGDLAFSPDGGPGGPGLRLASISFDHTIKIWDAETRQEILTIPAFELSLNRTYLLGITFSPDGCCIAATSGTTARIWDASTGKELLALPPQPDEVFSVAFSPDGKRLAIGLGFGYGASVWDIASGKKLADISGHQGSVNSLLFTRDGKRMITGSVDGTIKIWDAVTGQEQLTLARQETQITGLALSPDGEKLAASNMAGVARIYYLNVKDLVAEARQRLTRGLTLEECREYLHRDACPKE